MRMLVYIQMVFLLSAAWLSADDPSNLEISNVEFDYSGEEISGVLDIEIPSK